MNNKQLAPFTINIRGVIVNVVIMIEFYNLKSYNIYFILFAKKYALTEGMDALFDYLSKFFLSLYVSYRY